MKWKLNFVKWSSVFIFDGLEMNISSYYVINLAIRYEMFRNKLCRLLISIHSFREPKIQWSAIIFEIQIHI